MAKNNTTKPEHHYLRMIVIYVDGETSSNRVFKLKNRARAERWAARQEKSPVVKRVKIEPFTQSRQVWLARWHKLKASK